jgi:hypothetical protein
MRRFGLSVLMFATLSAGWGAGAAQAAGKKAAKASSAKETAAPPASADEVNKLKGDFRWGMSPDEVVSEIAQRIEESYADRIKATINDPTRQDRVRKEMRAEIEKAKKENFVKFDGQKTGYDVSIIDQEIGHGTGESMFVTKEATATRYFFFANDRLYKMFIAFDKEMLQGKSFQEFGQLMQAKFGKAKEVTVDQKLKAGVKKKVDHYVWHTKAGDSLRLVDRSEFYDVYCLVLADAATASRLADARKGRQGGGKRSDSLVEAVTSGQPSDRDPNDNVIDRLTGKTVHKPGDEPVQNIVVPSPSAAKAPTPAEVNKKDGDEGKKRPASKKNGRSDETQGLEL